MKNFNNFIKNKSLKNSNAINDILIKHLVIYLNTLKPVKFLHPLGKIFTAPPKPVGGVSFCATYWTYKKKTAQSGQTHLEISHERNHKLPCKPILLFKNPREYV